MPHKSLNQMGPRRAEATMASLYRIFTVPEHEDSTLGQIEREISQNIVGFLRQHDVVSEETPSALERDFNETKIPEGPMFVSEQAKFLLDKVMARSVHIASPSFVDHMTSALPYFMLPLAKIMMALNQNLVKIETSKAFTPLERQVVGMLHRLVYNQPESYYQRYTQDHEFALGTFCSGGTVANITALWVAINRLLAKTQGFDGLAEEGLFQAVSHYGYKGLKILVSKRGHYSFRKAANVLGLGKKNLLSIPTDQHNKIRLDALKDTILELKEQGIGIVAVVGIAGTTETGSVDPLEAMAEICSQHGIFFHVDAAWGGPTLFSQQHRGLLAGIDRADSVTLDAHKQLYVPMGAGMVLFRNESMLQLIEHQAKYIIRKGSRDLGRWTLEGSRPGMAMLVHSGLRIIGREGYEMLIDLGIEKAKSFAAMIAKEKDFELISAPELNLLTYRYVPAKLLKTLPLMPPLERAQWNEELNALTVAVQKDQRDYGKTFVSRTTLEPLAHDEKPINVFRAVLANPLTTYEILAEILREQREIATVQLKNPSFKLLAEWLV